MILILNVQARIKGEVVCLCDKSDICFQCETVKVLKRISRETGVPISLPSIRKPVMVQNEKPVDWLPAP